MTDKQRIDWLQKHGKDNFSLISDLAERWAVWGGERIVENHEWEKTVRKAIDRAIKEVK